MRIPETSVEVDEQCLKDVGESVRDSLKWGHSRGNMQDPEVIEFARDLVFQRIRQDNPEATEYEIYYAIGVIMRVVQDNLKKKMEST